MATAYQPWHYERHWRILNWRILAERLRVRGRQNLHRRYLERLGTTLPYLLSPFSVFSMFKMSRILYKNHLSMDVSFIISSRDMLSSKACQKEKRCFLWQTFYKCLIWLKHIATIPLHVIRRAWGYRLRMEPIFYHWCSSDKPTNAANYIR